MLAKLLLLLLLVQLVDGMGCLSHKCDVVVICVLFGTVAVVEVIFCVAAIVFVVVTVFVVFNGSGAGVEEKAGKDHISPIFLQ